MYNGLNKGWLLQSNHSIQVVELIPNGAKIDVTETNKLQYLDALAQYKLSRSIREEIEAFLKGLNDLIPDQLMSIFDENELELLICGTGNYSISDLKEHHTIIWGTAAFNKVGRDQLVLHYFPYPVSSCNVM